MIEDCHIWRTVDVHRLYVPLPDQETSERAVPTPAILLDKTVWYAPFLHYIAPPLQRIELLELATWQIQYAILL